MAKRIVICSDGTWNKREDASEKNTNVARLYDALIKDDQAIQIKFYDAGIGSGMYKLLGGATGLGISRNIKQCYSYLVEHYNEAEGDEIFLFGFSRGAYTVRSLAGLIHRCGILHSQYVDLVDDIYSLYRDKDVAAMEEIKMTKAKAGRIQMIGVWDTVGALGIPVNWINHFNPFFHRFHDTKLNSTIKFGFHALAIDDSRKTFSPTLWDESAIAENQTIEQIWFCGDHSDVGGGHKQRGLSDISLRWMMRKARARKLLFNDEDQGTVNPDTNGFLHNPRSGLSFFYRKQLRTIPETKKTMLFETVPERVESKKNKPDANYRPENLNHLETLEDHYTIVA